MAETLSKAKNTSVGGLVDTGIVGAARGRVRLLGSDTLGGASLDAARADREVRGLPTTR